MKIRPILLIAVLGAALCGGCARNYSIRMTNGAQITTASKPKLKNGYYVFKDVRGQENYVAQGRVVEIGPASKMTSDKAIFKPQTVR